jgi:hypothetical protein
MQAALDQTILRLESDFRGMKYPDIERLFDLFLSWAPIISVLPETAVFGVGEGYVIVEC